MVFETSQRLDKWVKNIEKNVKCICCGAEFTDYVD